jgi:hypothetical protein
MLPKAAGLDLDFEELGREMLRRKEELFPKGFPPTGEEAMVAATHSAGDSPAKAAHKTASKANGKSHGKKRASR